MANQLALVEDDRPGHERLALIKPLLRNLATRKQPIVTDAEIDAWLDDEGVNAEALAQQAGALPRTILIRHWRRYLLRGPQFQTKRGKMRRYQYELYAAERQASIDRQIEEHVRQNDAVAAGDDAWSRATVGPRR